MSEKAPEVLKPLNTFSHLAKARGGRANTR